MSLDRRLNRWIASPGKDSAINRDERKRQYQTKQELIRRLEAARADAIRRGGPVPRRLEGDLVEARISAEELRRDGHRELVRAIRGSTKADKGETLERLRRGMGIKQGDLALISGVSQTTISKIECGIVNPHRSTLWRLADALDTFGCEGAEDLIDVASRA